MPNSGCIPWFRSASNVSGIDVSTWEEKSDGDPRIISNNNALFEPLIEKPIRVALHAENNARANIREAFADLPPVVQSVKSSRQRNLQTQRNIVAGAALRCSQVGDALDALYQSAPINQSNEVQNNFGQRVACVLPIYDHHIAAAEVDAAAAVKRSAFYTSQIGRLMQRAPWKKIPNVRQQQRYQTQIEEAQRRIQALVATADTTLNEVELILDQIEEFEPDITERNLVNELREQAHLVELDAKGLSQKAVFRQKISDNVSVFESARPRLIDAKRDADLAALAEVHVEKIAANAEKRLVAVATKLVTVEQRDQVPLPRWAEHSASNPNEGIDASAGLKEHNLHLLKTEIDFFTQEADRIKGRRPLVQSARNLGAPLRQLKIENDRGRRQAAISCFEDSTAALAKMIAQLQARHARLKKEQTVQASATPAWHTINAERWACDLPGWRRAMRHHASAATAERALVGLYDGNKPNLVQGRHGLQRPPIGIPQGGATFAMDTPEAQDLLTQSKAHIANMIDIVNQTDDKHAAEALLSLVTSLSNQLDSAVHAAAEHEKKEVKLRRQSGSVFAKVAWFERSRIAIEHDEVLRDIGNTYEHFDATVKNITRIRNVAESALTKVETDVKINEPSNNVGDDAPRPPSLHDVHLPGPARRPVSTSDSPRAPRSLKNNDLAVVSWFKLCCSPGPDR